MRTDQGNDAAAKKGSKAGAAAADSSADRKAFKVIEDEGGGMIDLFS